MSWSRGLVWWGFSPRVLALPGAHTPPSASPDSKEGPKRFKFHLS